GLIDAVGELFLIRERLRVVLGNNLGGDARSVLDALSLRIRELHHQVLSVRMMPMRTLTDRYPRMVRDLARSLGKEVELVMDGGDIELDRAILDQIDACLVHVLRNAVDHGIESQAQRQKANK